MDDKCPACLGYKGEYVDEEHRQWVSCPECEGTGKRMDDRQKAIEAARAAGYDGRGGYLTRKRRVCDAPAWESVEFTDGIKRAIVTRVVPYSEVPTILSPLSVEMVASMMLDVEQTVPLTAVERAAIRQFQRIFIHRLRQQIEQGGAHDD